mmetsp:Transcript_28528/g.84470  ORF Transcript_28528/g.84470 Transcript_28528/m.84470 type:complete len:217 (-) Transcript_28528:837-1487(-)
MYAHAWPLDRHAGCCSVWCLSEAPMSPSDRALQDGSKIGVRRGGWGGRSLPPRAGREAEGLPSPGLQPGGGWHPVASQEPVLSQPKPELGPRGTLINRPSSPSPHSSAVLQQMARTSLLASSPMQPPASINLLHPLLPFTAPLFPPFLCPHCSRRQGPPSAHARARPQAARPAGAHHGAPLVHHQPAARGHHHERGLHARGTTARPPACRGHPRAS